MTGLASGEPERVGDVEDVARVLPVRIGTAFAVGRLGGILGPVYGATLFAAQLPTQVLFYAFAAPAVVGAVLVVLVPQGHGDAAPAAAPDDPTGAVSRL